MNDHRVPDREKLVATIEARAEKDVELDRPLAGVSDLMVIFGA